MKSIRLVNYKCFEDTGELELRPLNILVGSNSSGKSSLLEFFPLLQQSMKINRDGVFLWVGGNVDSDKFDTTVKHGKNNIIVEFNIDKIPLSNMNSRSMVFLNDVFLKIVISNSVVTGDAISEVEILFNDQVVRLNLKEAGSDEIEINGEKMIDGKVEVFHTPTNSLLPLMAFGIPFLEPHSEKHTKELVTWLKHNLKRDDRIIPSQFMYRPRIVFDRKEFDRFLNIQLKEDVNKEDLNHVYNLSLLYNVNELIDLINYYMIDLSDRIEFIQPLRATAERYYRNKNISVNKISPSGDNMAMFFLRMKKEMKLEEFNYWLHKNSFEFRVDIDEAGGFVEVKIIEEGKASMNMVDVGFGYSQILPILATIWKELYYNDGSRQRKSYCSTNLILIEQPELHLHPRFQHKFSDMLMRCVNLASESSVDLKFIIETHSKEIINNIGRNIAYNQFHPSLVNIYIFNAQRENMQHYIEKAGFTTEGFLDNWPVGFFS